MKMPVLKIGDLVAKVPIIQGGMGIGVSLHKLASAVANEGGIGVISGVQIGFNEEDFETNTQEANIRALKSEIRKAREASPNGILGVNLLVAMNNYKEAVKAAVEEKINIIISGAGLPSELPSFVKNSDTKIAPVVSSGRAASVISKLWDKRYSYAPDLVIVEGTEAGGHLGFSEEQLKDGNKPLLADIIKDVIEAVKPFSEKYKKNIPIIAAGGIYTGEDIAKHISAGASGVQMATRFVATEECDAHINFKMAYVNSTKDEIVIIKSPVGMPGRAIRNDFIKKIEHEKIKILKCYECLKPCNRMTTNYCISKALIDAVRGNIKDGLIFTGSNSYLINKMSTVKELINELIMEADTVLC
ncbi:MAG: nitronate monooxygenase family protein [Bacillota bacterium]|nr:nitronate monooxygenase family protein [Bacillota bacterium]